MFSYYLSFFSRSSLSLPPNNGELPNEEQINILSLPDGVLEKICVFTGPDSNFALACKKFSEIKKSAKFSGNYILERIIEGFKNSTFNNANLFASTCFVHKNLFTDSIISPSLNNHFVVRWALDLGHKKIALLLLKDPRTDVTFGDQFALINKNKNYAFKIACQKNYYKIVKFLLESKQFDPSMDNNAAIIEASENGYTKIVRLLLQDSRVDPSAQDSLALNHASYKGHYKVVALLLSDNRVKLFNGVVKSAMNGNFNILNLLLKHKNRITVDAINTAFVRAAACLDSSKNPKLIMKLFLSQARFLKIESKDKAIQIARCFEVIETLLNDFDVDPSTKDNEAFKLACRIGNIKSVILLLKHPKVNPGAENNYGIRIATSQGHLEIVQLLLTDPRVDPTDKQNGALAIATYYTSSSYWPPVYKEIANLLYKRVKYSLSWKERKLWRVFGEPIGNPDPNFISIKPKKVYNSRNPYIDF